MTVTLRSFAKINLGLCIGATRPDGYHDLRTVYQTVALHDVMTVSVGRGTGIEIQCEDPRVPRDASNTCWKIVERAMSTLGARGRVVIAIDKRLPVQGGLGGASGNAVAALIGLERALRKSLSGAERLRIAAEVGSDLPLFLIGGTVMGVGRGEDVYPVVDLPATPVVIVTPEIAVSTPKAFMDWDSLREPLGLKPDSVGNPNGTAEAVPLPKSGNKLTASSPSDRMNEFGRVLASWLSGSQKVLSGVSGRKRGGRAETLLDLVRTGIENDFEKVVFPQYPELCEVKRVLGQAGAFYASLSGSGSALYGLFRSRKQAERAASRLRKSGIPAVATTTLTRPQYWRRMRVSGF